MSTTRLLAGRSGGDGLDGALEEVAELKSLDKVPICAADSSARRRGKTLDSFFYSRVPDHATVLDANLFITLEDLADLLHTLIERRLCTNQQSLSLNISEGGRLTGKQQRQPA